MADARMEKNSIQHVIWTNDVLDAEDRVEKDQSFIDDFYMEEGHVETEDELYDRAYWYVEEWREDEAYNLESIKLSGNVLVTADLGLWYGRRSGFKVIKAKDAGDLLYAGLDDTVEYSTDNRGRLVVHGCNHDGSSTYYLYEIKEGVDPAFIEDRMYEGKPVKQYVRSIGRRINELYGFGTTGRRPAAAF